MHDYHDWHEAGNLWDCESANASWSSKVCKISENCARFRNCEAVCQNHPKSRFRSFTVRLFRPSWSRYCFWRSLFSSVSFSSSPSKAFKSFVPDFQSFKLNKMICWSFMKQIHLNLKFYVWIETTSWILGQTCKQQGEEMNRKYTLHSSAGSPPQAHLCLRPICWFSWLR